MSDAISWVTANWYYVLIAIGVAVNVLNSISKHYSQHVGLKKLVLFLTEILSVLTSAGARTDLGGKLKPPIVSIKPGDNK